MRSDLVPDCGSCAALCCVATSFEASDDFAFDKPAGLACRHLTHAGRCSIHDELAARGLSGCAIYDCHGAGQAVTRAFPVDERNAAFLHLRIVHELTWLLTGAAQLCLPLADAPGTLPDEIARAIDALDAIPRNRTLVDVDLRPHRARVHALLRRVGDAVGGRAGHRRGRASLVVVD